MTGNLPVRFVPLFINVSITRQTDNGVRARGQMGEGKAVNRWPLERTWPQELTSSQISSICTHTVSTNWAQWITGVKRSRVKEG